MPMDQDAHFRIATADDVESLVDLMMVSSWGGIRKAWERASAPSQSWRQRGASEIADPACEIGYTRFVVAEAGGRLAGMILINRLGDTGGLNPSLEPPEQAGAVALIKQAANSVFVREIAVVDWARGRGLATRFLGFAEHLAGANGLSRVTLIVNDANGPAHGLYAARGFRVVGSEPSIGHPAFDDGSMLLLMEKFAGKDIEDPAKQG